MIFSCNERLLNVAHAVAVEHYPNTAAVAREVTDGNPAVYNHLMAQAKACIQQVYNFTVPFVLLRLHDCVAPEQIQALNPTAASLETFPFSTMTTQWPI